MLLFGAEIDKFTKLLKVLQDSVDTLLSKVDLLDTRITAVERAVQTTTNKFEACATGFYQIREACTCLREELSEAAGNMVLTSWADGSVLD